MITDLEYIALHLRPEDQREIYGMRWDEDPLTLALETGEAINRGRGRVFHHNGKPAAVIGVVERHPHVWYAFAYGTQDLVACGKEMSSYAVNELKPYLLQQGAHRLECQSRYDHKRAHRWLTWLGAVRESTLRGFGRDGADYYNFAWTRG